MKRIKDSANHIKLAALMTLALSACATAPDRPRASDGPAPNDLLNATLWLQQAIEYKATADSVYALAHLRLDEALNDPTWTALPDDQQPGYEALPPAIILDADETVLDNSPYQAMLVETDQTYSNETWTAWAGAGEAGAVPGSLAFTRAAAAKGVTVFYVTNRNADVDEGTTRNLKDLGFPVKEGINAVMTVGEKPEWTSKKGTRRAAIAADYRVLMLFGDNLGDFVDDYKGSPAARQKVYETNAHHWGRDWLVLPNPGYGSWESSAFGNDYSLTREQQRARKLEQLKSWTPE
ncbi:HAD family acid phosphatase [Hyphococcus formosus]|uniref:5'-nucleotidase, lipoprotein e(P4) family n=1 Tax=Hyphococcus formosus TaxID=3143534 RepID=UPI00398B6473